MSGSFPDLSLKECVLVWLVHVEDQGAEDPGLAVTQAGIANATGLSRGHVSRTVAPLVEAGLVVEESKRVSGFSRALKGYRVTPVGKAEHARIRKALLRTEVAVRRGAGEPSRMTLEVVLSKHRLDLWTVVREVSEKGAVDLEASADVQPVRPRFMQDLSEAPPPQRFLGRDEDLEVVRAWLRGNAPVLVVEGPGGLGKTTVIGEAVRRFEPRRHVLWLRVDDWTTPQGIVDRVERLVRTLGRAPESLDPERLERLQERWAARLKGLPMLVVADDVQKADAGVRLVIEVLVRAARKAGSVKVAIIARQAQLAPDLVRNAARHSLPPLSDSSSKELLASLGVAPGQQGGLAQAGAGNPLFLQILAGRGAEGGIVDVYRFIERDLTANMPARHRALLGWVAALRRPEPPTFFARLGLGSPAAFEELEQAGLLVVRDDGALQMHDLVRDACYGQLGFEEARRVHARLADAYRPRGGGVGDMAEFLHHTVRAGRREEAVRWVLRNQSRLMAQASRLFEVEAGRTSGRRRTHQTTPP